MEQAISQDPSPASPVGLEHIVSVWEKSIDLQMHFNEICMNLRRTAIGAVGALLAAGALAFRFGGQVHIFNHVVSVAFLFAVIALLVWLSFYAMDRFWYHELLRASVKYAESLEEPARRAGLPVVLNMSAEIRRANHQALSMSGGAKINLFYLVVAAGLAVGCWWLYAGVIQPAVA
jgi:hypothetical protein